MTTKGSNKVIPFPGQPQQQPITGPVVDRYHGAAILDASGNEIPLTDTMINESLDALAKICAQHDKTV